MRMITGRSGRRVQWLVLLAVALAACTSGGGEGETAADPLAGEEGVTAAGEGGEGAEGDEGAEETYYWISQNSTLPLFVDNDHPALERAAEELGVTVEITGPTDIDLEAFIATINQVCAQSPAGVMVVGWDPSLSSAVDSCMEGGVPTVTVDADLPDSNRLSFIGTDWYQIGVAQAEVMIDVLGGEGEVATLSIINADNMTQARRGFEDTLADTNIEIVAEEDDGGDASEAATAVSSLLAAYPDLAGIAGFDSESGAGTVRALAEAGRTGEIAVTAMEQAPEFFQTVQRGEVDAIILQKRPLFTYYGVKMLYDFNNSGLRVRDLGTDLASPIPAEIDTGLLVATEDNIEEILSSAGLE